MDVILAALFWLCAPQAVGQLCGALDIDLTSHCIHVPRVDFMKNKPGFADPAAATRIVYQVAIVLHKFSELRERLGIPPVTVRINVMTRAPMSVTSRLSLKVVVFV